MTFTEQKHVCSIIFAFSFTFYLCVNLAFLSVNKLENITNFEPKSFLQYFCIREPDGTAERTTPRRDKD